MSLLFDPLDLGRGMTLQHRVVFAPCTRIRSPNHLPSSPLVREYYEQRASVPGTFLITEGTVISPRVGGYPGVPGIWSDEQISAWKQITDAVHAKGSYIFCQLWAHGRTGMPDVLELSGHDLISSSAVAMENGAVPREASEAEIWTVIGDYAQAARNAIAAGFDGIELHGANGYMIDQFTQDVCNKREDGWGGSIEKRARFGIEVAKAVSAAIGADRVGFRISPFSTFQDMRMKDPVPQFTYLIQELTKLKLGYLHIIEPRIHGNLESSAIGGESVDFAVEAWGTDRPVILAGGYRRVSAQEAVDLRYPTRKVLVAFGRYFISTPDLPFRIRLGIDPNPYDRETFYAAPEGDASVGYTDYPFSKEFQLRQNVVVS